MKRGRALSIVIGLALGSAAGIGAVSSQTTWLDEPAIEEVSLEWESIPIEITGEHDADPILIEDEIEVIPEEILGTEPEPMIVHTRTNDVATHWWEIPGEYENDPLIPDDIEEAALIYGGMFDICPEFLMAVCDRETGGTYRTDLIDETGTCFGCMQINIRAQRERIAAYGLTADDMLTADGGMIVAASYISELFAEYEDPAVVLMHYNGATIALRKYQKTGELNSYTRHVLNLAYEMEERHGKHQF